MFSKIKISLTDLGVGFGTEIPVGDVTTQPTTSLKHLQSLAFCALTEDVDGTFNKFCQYIGVSKENPMALDVKDLVSLLLESMRELRLILDYGCRRASIEEPMLPLADVPLKRLRMKAKQVASRWLSTWDNLKKISSDFVDITRGKVMDPLCSDYFGLVVCDQYIPVLRYQTNILFNKYSLVPKENAPPVPKVQMKTGPRFFLSSSFSLFLNRKMSPKRSNWILWNTVFQGFKKAIDPLSPMKVHRTVQDHENSLTKIPRELKPEVAYDFSRYLEEMRGKSGWSRYSSFKRSGLLSSNGSFDRTRREFGNLSELLSLLNIDIYDPNFYFSVGSRISVFQDDKESLVTRTFHSISDEDLEDLWELYILEKPCGRGSVRPAFILEPMKVRTITKGDCLTSSFLSKIQLWLHSNLSRFSGDPFEYVRRTVEEFPTGLESLLYDRSLPYVVSGDFKGATDTVSMEYSQFLIEKLEAFALSSLPMNLRRETLRWSMARRSLLSNTCVVEESSYPRDELITSRNGYTMPKGGYSYLQRNGQLMGSVISFPILCLINFFCYRRALDKYLGTTESWTEIVRKYPQHIVKIVGDDIIFRSDDRLYALWADEIKQAGFYLSVGKNYCQPNFGLFCSKLYDVSENVCHPEEGHRFIPYANMGLVYDRSKTAHDPIDLRQFDQRTAECPSRWKSRLNSIPEGIFNGRFTKVFLSRHQEKRDLFFPEHSDMDIRLWIQSVTPMMTMDPVVSSAVKLSSVLKMRCLDSIREKKRGEWLQVIAWNYFFGSSSSRTVSFFPF